MGQLLFKLRILVVMVVEIFGHRRLRREIEASLIMENEQEAEEFFQAGQQSSALRALYILNVGLASQALGDAKRVLDLGCGSGVMLTMLARMNPDTRFVGVDLSESMLELAREHAAEQGVENIEFRRMDMTRLELEDGSFDGVVSMFAFHHLPSFGHLRRSFREIRRVLEPGGALYLFDHGRPKRIRSVLALAYRDWAMMPYLYSLDSERSMRAAFLPRHFKVLAGELLAPSVSFFSSFKVSIYMGLSTPHTTLTDARRGMLLTWAGELEQKAWRDLDDMRVFLGLGGMPLDPFGELGSEALCQRRRQRLADFEILEHLVLRPSVRYVRSAMLFVRLGLSRLWPPRADDTRAYERLGRAFRRDLGSLKGPLMKLGQMLAYLSPSLPVPIRQSLSDLHDYSNPLDGSLVRRVVERELGKPVRELFSEWWDLPLAAASVSQVHLARLHSGELVAVKVKYPGIEAVVAHDLRVLDLLRPILIHVLGMANFDELLTELRTLLSLETNLRSAAAFQKAMRDAICDDQVLVPRVYDELTSEGVLTMEFVDGERYYDFAERASQAEKNEAARVIWRFTAESLLRHGVYNADPHPGNYLFLDGKVCFLDFGFTKRFSWTFIQNWRRHHRAALDEDLPTFAETNRALGFVVDEDAFDDELLLELYRDVILVPFREDETFRWSKEFVRNEIGSLVQSMTRLRGNRLLPEMVSMFRLYWGLHTLLADLGAVGNFHHAVVPLFDQSLPEPAWHAELADAVA